MVSKHLYQLLQNNLKHNSNYFQNNFEYQILLLNNILFMFENLFGIGLVKPFKNNAIGISFLSNLSLNYSNFNKLPL